MYIKTSGKMVRRIFAILGLLLIGTCYGGSYPNSYPNQNDLYFPTFGSSAVIYLHLLCSMIFDLQGLLTYLNINLFELMKGWYLAKVGSKGCTIVADFGRAASYPTFVRTEMPPFYSPVMLDIVWNFGIKGVVFQNKVLYSIPALVQTFKILFSIFYLHLHFFSELWRSFKSRMEL